MTEFSRDFPPTAGLGFSSPRKIAATGGGELQHSRHFYTGPLTDAGSATAHAEYRPQPGEGAQPPGAVSDRPPVQSGHPVERAAVTPTDSGATDAQIEARARRLIILRELAKAKRSHGPTAGLRARLRAVTAECV